MQSLKRLIALALLMLPLVPAGSALAAPPANDADAVTDAVDLATKERLLSDAAHAWSYFTRESGSLPGMTSVNIWQDGDGYGSYDIATMWDTGSIILATISARSIGLIEQAEFDDRISGIMAFLDRATTTYEGATLPNFRSSTKTGESVEEGYDATDTGRLFVALHVLEGVTSGKFKAASLMKKWNIAATVSEGAMQDIKRGAMSPAQSNIYRYYVSRGYKLWDVPHAPVYSGLAPDKSKAARAKFLEELASIGPISTEPSVNEIVEIGASPFANVIAETLGKAQRERYEQTGKLTAVSEGSIDKAPWFTYQGYDLDREGQGERAWTVYSWRTDEKWATDTFAENFRVISSKAAFLWFAVYPDDYTKKLWEEVREKARAEQFGFFPGVYEKNGVAAQNLDVNTNAMILSSIAYILNGRKPLVTAHAGS